MKITSLLLIMLPLGFAAGCSSDRGAASSPAYTETGPVLAVQPAYPGPTAEPAIQPPPPAPPPSAATMDIAVGKEISLLLTRDRGLHRMSRNVVTTVKKGVVVLRGTVVSEHDRTELAERIRKLPGVDQVVNHLGIEYR